MLRVLSLKMIFFGFFAIVFSFIVSINAQSVSISVRNTKINGLTKSWNGTKVSTFLGIPYAQPPIGNLRFKKPEPLTAWPEMIDAKDWPAACMQIRGYLNLSKPASEDCLYLNIWSPMSTDNKLKPVMVWIHGGANNMGSSNELNYDSTILSAMGDVVVVTLNYRLGIFGFLYTGTEVGPGNMGLWDQALALKWVNDNIEWFGGDPNKITLFGESAGSMDTSAHILSPVSRNYFQNAIMMSGAALGAFGVHEPEESLNYWKSAAKLVGCADDQNSVEDQLSQQQIDCLNKVPGDKLAPVSFAQELFMGYAVYSPLFVMDGRFFTQKPMKMIESGNYKKNLNLMIGNTEDEGSPLLSDLVDPVKYDRNSPHNLTLKEAVNEMKRILALLPTKKKVNTEEVAKLYFTGMSDKSDVNQLRRTIGNAFGDYLITCPTIQFAKALFKRNWKSLNVYQYYFNSKLGEVKLVCGKWMGTCHGNDVWPVFGHPFSKFDRSLSREREISAQMMRFFSDFAKTGKPTAQDGTEWPSYYTVNNIIAAPYYEITNQPKRRSNFDTGLKINECNFLWKHYID